MRILISKSLLVQVVAINIFANIFDKFVARLLDFTSPYIQQLIQRLS